MSQALRDTARAIFANALQAVDVRSAVQSRISRQGDTLTFAGKAVRLDEFDRVILIAMGKAAVPMYTAAAEVLRGLRQTAIIIAPQETLPTTRKADGCDADAVSGVVYLPGAHPTPTTDSLHAAACVLALLRTVTPRTIVLFLISGGASAMVEQPLDPAIPLDDLASFSQALVGSGMGITGMNTLRKHLSAVKGGRLAVAAAAARMQCTLLISDVPHASPDAVASGPSLPDGASLPEVRLLFDLLLRSSSQPESVIRWFQSAHLPGTPKAADGAFARSHWEVILSSEHLARAAIVEAEERGFYPVLDNTCDDWDYREAGGHLLDRCMGLRAEKHLPICLITVGEVGVTLTPKPGEGGRNQQLALWCAQSLAARGQAATMLSGGSDGIDGHSSAAGAVCDETTLSRATAAGFSVADALRRFDCAPLLLAIGDAITTGPTGNNLRDLRLVLTEPR